MSKGFVDALITGVGNVLPDLVGSVWNAATTSGKTPSEELKEAMKDIDVLLNERSKMSLPDETKGNKP